MAERCPICKELHTAWVMVHMVQPSRGEDELIGCQYCIYKTDVWFEFNQPITRAEDREAAEAEGI